MSKPQAVEQSAGHLIVESLKAHGVKRTYVVPGESYLDVLDGLYNSGIESIVCRHEGGATYMAEAEGKLNDVPGVAMVTRGPGALTPTSACTPHGRTRPRSCCSSV